MQDKTTQNFNIPLNRQDDSNELAVVSHPLLKQAEWNLDEILQQHGVFLVKCWLQAAKRSGFSRDESRFVLKEAAEGDYIHLVKTLQKYSNDGKSNR